MKEDGNSGLRVVGNYSLGGRRGRRFILVLRWRQKESSAVLMKAEILCLCKHAFKC